jgi:hypothetical protein
MMRILACTLFAAAMLVLMVGCGGGTNTGGDPVDSGDVHSTNEEQVVGGPEWFFNPPREPGKAFYGVGMMTYRNPAMLQNARDLAFTSARNEIASSMQSTIQSATKRYMRTIITPENDMEEEQFAQSVARSVVDLKLSGANVVKSDRTFMKNEKQYAVYILARISFDDVAQTLHEQMTEAVEKVQENARVAFDELDRLLEEEQEKAGK